MTKNRRHIAILIIALIAINYLSSLLYTRLDLTNDKRYTLSEASKNVVKNVDDLIYIDVFLEGNDFPSEFRRLKTETRLLLEEFTNINNNIKFGFINPLKDDATRENNIQQLTQRGLTPMQINVQENGKASQEIIFPWALASYNGNTIKIPLVKTKIGENQEDLISNSVQHLEYAFADGFNKLINEKSRKIAILKGNGQLEDKYIFDFAKTLRDYYFIAPFTLDSVQNNAEQTLQKLNNFDLIINAKPTEKFSEEEKYVLDQYIMNGGKALWLIDAVAIEKDSLYNNQGESTALPQDLNLTDFFFKYGVRINPVLLSSLYSAPISLAIGEGNNAQIQNLQWPYSPLASTNSTHPIVNNLDLIRFDFANQIDTLKNSVSKTILLESAPQTKLDGTPRLISLDLVTKQPDASKFNQGNQALAVLLEGKFTSVYNNRIKPFKLKNQRNESLETKQIVIADGDVIKNEFGRTGPLQLGFDKGTGRTFGNKEFLLNAVNYLLDDDGLINIRSKEINVAFLNQEKIASSKTKWQLVNILLPLAILAVFGLVFNYFRRKKYVYKS